ncbi:MAG: hypothetical protein ACK55I_07070, partial [bacterium]
MHPILIGLQQLLAAHGNRSRAPGLGPGLGRHRDRMQGGTARCGGIDGFLRQGWQWPLQQPVRTVPTAGRIGGAIPFDAIPPPEEKHRQRGVQKGLEQGAGVRPIIRTGAQGHQ